MTKTKKILALLLATMMSTSLVAMSACNNTSGNDSTSNTTSENNDSTKVECTEHVYSEDLVCIQEPTCLEVGKKAIACVNCGTVKGDVADITARGHDYKSNGTCARCGETPTLPKTDANATYINIYDTDSSCKGTDFDRYPVATDNYYEIEIGRTKSLWISVAVPEAGQYAVYSIENNGVSIKRYDASTQYIPIDQEGNYIGYEQGNLANGNFISTVSCGDIYWSDQWRATFCFSGNAGSTAKIRIVKIDDAAWQPGYVRKDVLAEQIDGKAPNGPEGAIPTVVPYDTEYFYDYNEETDTGYYRMGTPENPGDIIYVAITAVAERLLLDKSLSVIQYEGNNLTLGDGTTADGDYLLRQYAPFIMSDETYGGTSNCYELYVNDDGMYPVNQELFEFLNLYVKNTKPMDIPDEIWDDVTKRENSAWLSACYYYDVLPLGSQLNPYKVTDNKFTVETKEYEYVYYNIRYTNETDSNAYVSYVDIICEDPNALLYINNQPHFAPFNVRIETNYSVGADLMFASKDGSAISYEIVLQDATDGAADYPFALTPDANGDVTLDFIPIYMLDGSVSNECYYEYTATQSGTLTFSTDADIYFLATNKTVDENASSTDGEESTATDTYLNANGEAKMNVKAGDVIAIYVSNQTADSVVLNIKN